MRILFGILQVLLLFGIAWTVPSVFASFDDTLSNFTAFLCLARAYFAVVSVIDACNFKIILNPSFVNACLTFPPAIIWIVCFFTSTTPEFYTIFVVGVCIDISAVIFGDVFKSKRLGLVLRHEKAGFGLDSNLISITAETQTYFGICVWYLFETRKFTEYPDFVSAVNFEPINFFYGSLAALILFNIYSLYNYGLKFWMINSDRHLQNHPSKIFLYSTIVRWLHFIIIGLSGLLTATLSLLAFDLYSSSSILVNQFPLTLTSFPETVRFNRNMEIDYLKQAVSAGGIVISPRSSFYLPVITGVFGVYLICQSFVEIAACRLSRVDVKIKTLSTLIPGIVIMLLAFLPDTVWQDPSAKIIVLSSAFGISIIILGISQFFVMLI